jgi:hypothetical protein
VASDASVRGSAGRDGKRDGEGSRNRYLAIVLTFAAVLAIGVQVQDIQGGNALGLVVMECMDPLSWWVFRR